MAKFFSSLPRLLQTSDIFGSFFRIFPRCLCHFRLRDTSSGIPIPSSFYDEANGIFFGVRMTPLAHFCDGLRTVLKPSHGSATFFYFFWRFFSASGRHAQCCDGFRRMFIRSIGYPIGDHFCPDGRWYSMQTATDPKPDIERRCSVLTIKDVDVNVAPDYRAVSHRRGSFSRSVRGSVRVRTALGLVHYSGHAALMQVAV